MILINYLDFKAMQREESYEEQLRVCSAQLKDVRFISIAWKLLFIQKIFGFFSYKIYIKNIKITLFCKI